MTTHHTAERHAARRIALCGATQRDVVAAECFARARALGVANDRAGAHFRHVDAKLLQSRHLAHVVQPLATTTKHTAHRRQLAACFQWCGFHEWCACCLAETHRRSRTDPRQRPQSRAPRASPAQRMHAGHEALWRSTAHGSCLAARPPCRGECFARPSPRRARTRRDMLQLPRARHGRAATDPLLMVVVFNRRDARPVFDVDEPTRSSLRLRDLSYRTIIGARAPAGWLFSHARARRTRGSRWKGPRGDDARGL